jgi:hypothetical protein
MESSPMSVLRTPNDVLHSTLGLVAKRLRYDAAGTAEEPLPERWVELIRGLDEQERRLHATNEDKNPPSAGREEPH